MNWIYHLVGKVFFRRQQDWEREKNAKIMTWVFLFSLLLALGFALLIKFLSSQVR
jgi:hypothetical protein